jgi:hypothetical protein
MPINLINPANIFRPFAIRYELGEPTDGCLRYSIDTTSSLAFTIATCTILTGNRMIEIFVDSDTDVNVTNLIDDSTGDYVEAATVEWSLETQYGVAVSGASGTCDHVENGDYLGCIPDTVSLTAGVVYVLVVTITDGNHDATSRTPVIASYKT